MTHVYWFVVWWVLDDLKELKSLFLRIWRFTFNSIMSPHSSHSKNIMISLITKDLKQKSKLNLQVILLRTIFPSSLVSFVYQWLSRMLLAQHRTSTGKLWMVPILFFVSFLFLGITITMRFHFHIFLGMKLLWSVVFFKRWPNWKHWKCHFSSCNTSTKHFRNPCFKKLPITLHKKEKLGSEARGYRKSSWDVNVDEMGAGLWHVDWNHIIKSFHFLGNGSALKPWFHK